MNYLEYIQHANCIDVTPT